MNETLLDNWKNANLEGLHRRSNEISQELKRLDSEKQNLKEEMKVIWYCIGKQEGKSSK